MLVYGRQLAFLALASLPPVGQAGLVTAAYASTVKALVAVIGTLNAEIKTLEGEVEAHFGRHPDAELYRSHDLAA